MKKFSFFALVVAVMMIISACSTQAGLLLKQSTLKQLEVESFEGSSTVSFDIDTQMYKNTFDIQVDTKQIDMFNTVVDIHIPSNLLLLAGVEVEDGLTVSIISKDGDSLIGFPQDDIGFSLATMDEAFEGLIEEEKEKVEQLIVTLQEAMIELAKQYIQDFNFSLKHIENHGNVKVTLPNGEKVDTTHVEVKLDALEALDLLHYSFTYFLENESFQQSFYETIAQLPQMFGDLGEVEEEIDFDIEEIKEEMNSAIALIASELEMVRTDLEEHADMISELATVSLHSYIGKDKETYKTEFIFNIAYTEKIANLQLEELEGLPFAPGDSITISTEDYMWNHNKTVAPIELPSRIITMDELNEVEDAEGFKQLVGEDTIIAQLADEFEAFFGSFGGYGFVDLYLDEKKAYTMNGEFDVSVYVKNGQTMVPLKFIAEELGSEVTWVPETRDIIVEGNGHIIEIDKDRTVMVDGQVTKNIHIDIINGTSYVNVRAFAEAMDWTVIWDSELNSVFIF